MHGLDWTPSSIWICIVRTCPCWTTVTKELMACWTVPLGSFNCLSVMPWLIHCDWSVAPVELCHKAALIVCLCYPGLSILTEVFLLNCATRQLLSVLPPLTYCDWRVACWIVPHGSFNCLCCPGLYIVTEVLPVELCHKAAIVCVALAYPVIKSCLLNCATRQF